MLVYIYDCSIPPPKNCKNFKLLSFSRGMKVKEMSHIEVSSISSVGLRKCRIKAPDFPCQNNTSESVIYS